MYSPFQIKESDKFSRAKLKVAVVWFWDQASSIMPNWRDGHRAAIEEIAKKHEVVWFLNKQAPDSTEHWDFILLWDDSNSGFFTDIAKYDCRKGMILTTDPQNFDNLRKIDVVFVESVPVYEAVRAQGIRTIRAMGTDTSFYRPKKREKDIEYFYPATFSPWKRQQDIAYLGEKLTCIGTLQPDGVEELRFCEEAHVNTIIDYLPAEVIKDYYQRAQHVIIPAVHGSERTVLEAMACNILPEVTNPVNVRTASYIKEYEEALKKDPKMTPRKFVVVNYSHKVFARNLLKGIEHG